MSTLFHNWIEFIDTFNRFVFNKHENGADGGKEANDWLQKYAFVNEAMQAGLHLV